MYRVYGMHDCLNVVERAPRHGRRRPGARRRAARRRRGDARRPGRACPGRPAACCRADPRRAAPASRRIPDARLAGGPALVAAAFSVGRVDDGRDLLDPGASLRLEAAPRGEPPIAVAAGRARRAWPTPASRGPDRPGASWAAGHESDPSAASWPARQPRADGRQVDRPPRVPARPRAPGRRRGLPARPPPRRGAGAVGGPGPRRDGPRGDDAGPGPARRAARARGSAGAHDIGPASSGPPAAAGSTPAQFVDDRPDARGRRRACATTLADDRRPLLHELARQPPPAAGPALHARAELRSGRRAARHGVAAPGRPAPGGPDRLRAAAHAARAAGPLAASSAAPSRSRSSRCATAATWSRSAPTPGAGSRGSSTTRRAAARRSSWSRSWRSSWATPGARRSWPSRPRSSGSSTSCRRSSAARPARSGRRSTRSPGSTSGARRRAWPRRWTRPGRETPTRAEIVLLGARHPGLAGRVVPIDVRLGGRLPGARRDRPEHRRQDGHAADARPPRPDAPGRPPRPGRAGQPPARSCGTCSPTSATSSRSPSRLSTFSGHLRSIVRIAAAAGPDTLVLLDELGAGTDPTEGSALAQALLDHFLRAGALVAATTHYAELKVYAHTTPRRAQRLGRVRPRDAQSRRTTSGSACPGGSQAFAIAERLGLPAADRRRRPLAPDRGPAGLRGDARLDPRGRRGRPRRRSSAPARPRPRAARGAAGRRGGAPPGPARAGRVRARPPGPTPSAWSRTCATEIRGARRRLERETVTAPALDAVLERAEGRLARLPALEPGPAAAPPAGSARGLAGGGPGAEPVAGLGGPDRRPRARREAGQLEVGGMRVTVGVEDLDARSGRGRGGCRRDGLGAAGDVRGGGRHGDRRPCAWSGPGRSRRRSTYGAPGWTRRSRWWSATWRTPPWPGLERVTIIHGLGTGALRDAVRRAAAAHPLVRSVRPGERGEGGDGATVVAF